MTADDLNNKFKGKNVEIYGLHPGKNRQGYRHSGTFMAAYDLDNGEVGFSLNMYNTFYVDYWRIGIDGIWYGFYGAEAHSGEPGMLYIKLKDKK